MWRAAGQRAQMSISSLRTKLVCGIQPPRATFGAEPSRLDPRNSFQELTEPQEAGRGARRRASFESAAWRRSGTTGCCNGDAEQRRDNAIAEAIAWAGRTPPFRPFRARPLLLPREGGVGVQGR